jgi:hypothetical protein
VRRSGRRLRILWGMMRRCKIDITWGELGWSIVFL